MALSGTMLIERPVGRPMLKNSTGVLRLQGPRPLRLQSRSASTGRRLVNNARSTNCSFWVYKLHTMQQNPIELYHM